MATYTNSPLVDCTKLSPNHSGQRTHSIDRISPHCVVGQCSAERIGEIFAPTSRQASSNYGIGYDGRVGLYVEEKNRSWCTSSNANDQRAITIEVASDTTHPYAMRDAAYNKLVDLCVDICQRNGKKKLLWFADKNKTLAYEPAADEMIITVHRWFANKSCPGDWLYNRLGDLATTVTKRLGGSSNASTETSKTTYKVQTGAFSKEQNAKNLAAKLKADGFDTYIIKENGLWKVQTGAYSKKPNAEAQVEKLKAKGYDAIIKTVTTGTATNASTSTSTPAKTEEPKKEEPKVEVVTISKGDTVTVKSGAKTYTGGGLASFVYKTKYTVLEEPKGDRVVIGLNGQVTAAVNAKDLTVVKKANGTSVATKPAASATPAAPKKTEFHKGDKVTVNQSAKTYTGGGLASFVYKTTYTVLEEPKGDRVVIGINGAVTAAVNAKDLKHK